MNFYLINFLLEKLLFNKSSNKRSRIIMRNIFVAIPIRFIISFRDVTVGNDTLMYEHLYKVHSYLSVNESLNYSGMEKLFVIILNVLGHLGFSYYAYQLVISTILCILFGLYIYRYSLSSSLSWFFFVTFLYMARSMNITREMLAVSISVVAFMLINEKKIIRFIIVCTVSYFIHKTAIFQLLLLPFLLIKKEYIMNIITICIVLIILIFFNKVTSTFVLIVDKYDYLLDSKYMDTSGGIAKYINLIFIFLILVWFNIYKKQLKRDTDLSCGIIDIDFKEKVLKIYLMVALIFSFVGLKFGLADRCALYFTLPVVILLPNMLKNIKNKNNRLVITIFVIFLSSLYFILVLYFRNDWHTIVPYKTWIT